MEKNEKYYLLVVRFSNGVKRYTIYNHWVKRSKVFDTLEKARDEVFRLAYLNKHILNLEEDIIETGVLFNAVGQKDESYIVEGLKMVENELGTGI